MSAHLRLLGMALMWGASWPAGRILALNMPPLAASALRFLLAATLLLPWLYFSGGLGALRHWSVKTWLGMFAAGATGVFGYASFFLTGLQHLPAGKAALLAGGLRGRRMLLKSPMHTARIALLDGLFPRASYVYIHRHPYDVFQSACNMAEKTYSLTYLDDPTDDPFKAALIHVLQLLALTQFMHTGEELTVIPTDFDVVCALECVNV